MLQLEVPVVIRSPTHAYAEALVGRIVEVVLCQLIVSGYRTRFWHDATEARVLQANLLGGTDIVDIPAFLDVVDRDARCQGIVNDGDVGIGLNGIAAIRVAGFRNRDIKSSAEFVELGLVGDEPDGARL